MNASVSLSCENNQSMKLNPVVVRMQLQEIGTFRQEMLFFHLQDSLPSTLDLD